MGWWSQNSKPPNEVLERLTCQNTQGCCQVPIQSIDIVQQVEILHNCLLSSSWSLYHMLDTEYNRHPVVKQNKECVSVRFVELLSTFKAMLVNLQIRHCTVWWLRLDHRCCLCARPHCPCNQTGSIVDYTSRCEAAHLTHTRSCKSEVRVCTIDTCCCWSRWHKKWNLQCYMTYILVVGKEWYKSYTLCRSSDHCHWLQRWSASGSKAQRLRHNSSRIGNSNLPSWYILQYHENSQNQIQSNRNSPFRCKLPIALQTNCCVLFDAE